MRARRSSTVKAWRVAWGATLDVSALRQLRLGCSFVPRVQPNNWFTVAEDPRPTTVTQFELSYGRERARTEHNLQALKAARETKRPFIARRAGFVDLFLPVIDDGVVEGVLVCGPILDRQPTLESLELAWRDISDAPLDPEDERFVRFVRSALDSHVFEGRAFELLVNHIRALVSVMQGHAGSPFERHMRVWLALRKEVPEVRMWDLASDLVDPRANPRWMPSYRAVDRSLLGIARMPNYVIAVAPFWRDAAAQNTAELVLRNHRFQRTCAALAAELPNTVSGRIGGEAAFFLTHVPDGPKRRIRSQLSALGERFRRRIRRELRTDVVCGVSNLAVHGGELPLRYDEALRAVFWGLHRHAPLTYYADALQDETTANPGLYRSSRLLYEALARGSGRESALAAQEVVKDVLWIAGGSLEVMRSHFLRILWELLALVEQRALVEKRTSSEMETRLAESLKRARATHEVTRQFTELVGELADAVEHPASVNLRAKLRRARRLVELSLIDGGTQQRLDRDSIAAEVGMSPSNFTRTFRLAYGVPFQDFVLKARIERSKQLLRDTDLQVTEVSSAAGWGSPSYFHQAFKRIVGMTPDAYRAGN